MRCPVLGERTQYEEKMDEREAKPIPATCHPKSPRSPQKKEPAQPGFNRPKHAGSASQ